MRIERADIVMLGRERVNCAKQVDKIHWRFLKRGLSEGKREREGL